MHARAQQLIDTLALKPHPEGGWYRPLFKSEERVTRHADGVQRSALTTIYFLLVEGTYSAWHRVLSDEAWHFYEGDALELLMRTDEADAPRITRLDPDHRVHVVRAREWQAARTLGAYSLVGCTVGPGFEFDDFEMKPGPI
ncbi:MAG TPA: cupin domain-containing protein [Thermoanaerobaculia bacterium]|nr:cupin domain-containing protein [Thermoanaerobaculia bacterium]